MLARPSILLIDDSLGECELFRAALKEAGLAVLLLAESTTEETFRFLAKTDGATPLPSLILLDLKLGQQHGLDLLRRLRGNSRTRHLPVIVFTTSDDPADLAACYAAGANGYVTKPDTYEALLHFITDLHNYWFRWNRSMWPVEPSVQWRIGDTNFLVGGGVLFTLAGQNATNSIYPNFSIFYYWSKSGKVMMR